MNKYQSTKKEICITCGKSEMRLGMYRRKKDKKWFCREHLKTNQEKE